ncbi:unnamed protein product [Moneuplotes crassus]|uniref:Uncharacterized protein n=1 Tax=Euplotes crassus TaxID=5936 RepID=A0AAD2D4M3_EUPCR|nr:unnamed protein product [Moneuplotes crassus]
MNSLNLENESCFPSCRKSNNDDLLIFQSQNSFDSAKDKRLEFQNEYEFNSEYLKNTPYEHSRNKNPKSFISNPKIYKTRQDHNSYTYQISKSYSKKSANKDPSTTSSLINVLTEFKRLKNEKNTQKKQPRIRLYQPLRRVDIGDSLFRLQRVSIKPLGEKKLRFIRNSRHCSLSSAVVGSEVDQNKGRIGLQGYSLPSSGKVKACGRNEYSVNLENYGQPLDRSKRGDLCRTMEDNNEYNLSKIGMTETKAIERDVMDELELFPSLKRSLDAMSQRKSISKDSLSPSAKKSSVCYPSAHNKVKIQKLSKRQKEEKERLRLANKSAVVQLNYSKKIFRKDSMPQIPKFSKDSNNAGITNGRYQDQDSASPALRSSQINNKLPKIEFEFIDESFDLVKKSSQEILKLRKQLMITAQFEKIKARNKQNAYIELFKEYNELAKTHQGRNNPYDDAVDFLITNRHTLVGMKQDSAKIKKNPYLKQKESQKKPKDIEPEIKPPVLSPEQIQEARLLRYGRNLAKQLRLDKHKVRHEPRQSIMFD